MLAVCYSHEITDSISMIYHKTKRIYCNYEDKYIRAKSMRHYGITVNETLPNQAENSADEGIETVEIMTMWLVRTR